MIKEKISLLNKYLKSERQMTPSEKRALLSQLLFEQTSHTHPLSYNQLGVWVLNEVSFKAPLNFAVCGYLKSNVDEAALKKSCKILTDRHPVLRTTYYVKEGQPRQTVQPQGQIDFKVVDVSQCSKSKVDRLVKESYEKNFDLEKGPLMRCRLFASSNKEFIFLMTLHHIACDGWSLWLLVDEIKTIYSALVKGTVPVLAKIDKTYVQFAKNQQDFVNGPMGQEQLNYWKKRLSGDLPILNLPFKDSRSAVKTSRGEYFPFLLSEKMKKALNDYAQKQGVTLYMLLLAAYKVLLYRYSGQEDIIIGTPVSVRDQENYSQVVGNFINSICLRSNLSENPPFEVFLRSVKKTVVGAIAHREYPYITLAEQYQKNHDSSVLPIFQARFSFQMGAKNHIPTELFINEGNQDPIPFGELLVEPYELIQQAGLYDIFFRSHGN